MSMFQLNGHDFEFSLNNLPCLIHGTHGAGSSYFTVRLVADLFNKGNEIIFLSGFHMARDEFKELTKIEADSDRVIFIKLEESDRLVDLSKNLKGIDGYIILVKNFELFDQDVIESILDKPKLLLSGNLDECSFKDILLRHQYATRITFSQSENFLLIPEKLSKYHAYMETDREKGIVAISK